MNSLTRENNLLKVEIATLKNRLNIILNIIILKYIMVLKRKGVSSGLGDRLGNYLINSMLGYMLNEDIYTYWVTDTDRSKEYPSNILDYIHFPKNLLFVSQDEYV